MSSSNGHRSTASCYPLRPIVGTDPCPAPNNARTNSVENEAQTYTDWLQSTDVPPLSPDVSDHRLHASRFDSARRCYQSNGPRLLLAGPSVVCNGTSMLLTSFGTVLKLSSERTGERLAEQKAVTRMARINAALRTAGSPLTATTLKQQFFLTSSSR